MHRKPWRTIPAIALVALVLPATAQSAAAQSNIYWTDWMSSASTGGGAGTVTGTLTAPGASTTITYAGELAFAQTAPTGNSNYFLPRSTFLGGSYSDGAPITTDLIAISGGRIGSNVFTFSSPVVNPFISFISMGGVNTPVSYTFDAPFTIVAGGPSAVYGGSTITASGNTVTGREGSGTVLFEGTFTTLSFTTSGSEFWNGFTIGVADVGSTGPTPPPSTVPEPATLALVGLGLAGIATLRRRRATR